MARSAGKNSRREPTSNLAAIHLIEAGMQRITANTSSTLVAPVEPPASELLFLVGRPPIPDYLVFMRSHTIGGQLLTDRVLMDTWRTANDHVQQLQNHEAGCADGAKLTPLPASMVPLSETIAGAPVLAQYALPVEIGLVDLDRLVTYQRHINLEHSRRLQAELGPTPSDEAVFSICFPLDTPRPSVTLSGGGNAFAFLSPSNDLRVLGIVPLSPDRVSGLEMYGPVSSVIGVLVGYSTNWMSALFVEDRLVLMQGTHRAHALRAAGLTHVPCLVQHVSTRDELQVLQIPELLQQGDVYLKQARPPLLKDFFDERLRTVVRVPRRYHQVVVQLEMHAGAIDLPAA